MTGGEVLRVVPFRGSWKVSHPCPQCGEDWHVHATFKPARAAGRFLWWRWPARAATWTAYCGQCSHSYTIGARIYDVSS